MRLAPYRPRPGIKSPSRKAAIGALCVAALMGFYGFATSVQKAATLRSAGGAGSGIAAAQADASRPAVAVAAPPTLAFSVVDTTLAQATPAPPKATRVAAPATPSADELAMDAAAIAPAPGETERAELISQPVAEAPPNEISVPTTPLVVPPAEPAVEISTPTP